MPGRITIFTCGLMLAGPGQARRVGSRFTGLRLQCSALALDAISLTLDQVQTNLRMGLISLGLWIIVWRLLSHGLFSPFLLDLPN